MLHYDEILIAFWSAEFGGICLKSILECQHQGHEAERGVLCPNRTPAIRQRVYCDCKSKKQPDVQPKNDKKLVV